MKEHVDHASVFVGYIEKWMTNRGFKMTSTLGTDSSRSGRAVHERSPGLHNLLR